MTGEQEDVAKNVGHLLAKILGDLCLGFIFEAGTSFHHEIALNQLPHLFLELEDIPVAITPDPKLFGIEIGDFFDLSSYFVNVHTGDYSTR